MSGDQMPPEPGGDPTTSAAASEQALDHLLAELHAARSAAIQAGADPEAVTLGLQERLRRVRGMLGAHEDDAPPGDG